MNHRYVIVLALWIINLVTTTRMRPVESCGVTWEGWQPTTSGVTRKYPMPASGAGCVPLVAPGNMDRNIKMTWSSSLSGGSSTTDKTNVRSRNTGSQRAAQRTPISVKRLSLIHI